MGTPDRSEGWLYARDYASCFAFLSLQVLTAQWVASYSVPDNLTQTHVSKYLYCSGALDVSLQHGLPFLSSTQILMELLLFSSYLNKIIFSFVSPSFLFMSCPKVQLKSKCFSFKQEERYNIYPKGTFYKRTTAHISGYKTRSKLWRRSRPWIILLYFLPCLVIIKDLVPGIHTAARKENSEEGAMVSGDREIYDSWPGHYLYSFHRHVRLPYLAVSSGMWEQLFIQSVKSRKMWKSQLQRSLLTLNLAILFSITADRRNERELRTKNHQIT